MSDRKFAFAMQWEESDREFEIDKCDFLFEIDGNKTKNPITLSNEDLMKIAGGVQNAVTMLFMTAGYKIIKTEIKEQ